MLPKIFCILLAISSIFQLQKILFTKNDFLYRKSVQLLSELEDSVLDWDDIHLRQCKSTKPPEYPPLCSTKLAFTHNEEYCLNSDTYKLLHPEEVLRDKFVMRDQYGDDQDLQRLLIRANYFDAAPNFKQLETEPPQNVKKQLDLPNQLIYYYVHQKNMNNQFKYGKEAICQFQKYGHVPGQYLISQKSQMYALIHEYLHALKQRKASEQCIDDATIVKQSYRMWVEQECKQAIQILSKPGYIDDVAKYGVHHVMKTDVHRGEGVFLLFEKQVKEVLKNYNNGQKCGQNRTYSVIQDYITRPYLYFGHKLEFRIYFKIASTNPYILYVYGSSLVKQCGAKYDARSQNKEAHVCNTAIIKHSQDSSGQKNRDDKYIDWDLDNFQELLLDQGIVTDSDWLNKEFLPQIYKKIIHIFQASKHNFFKSSRVDELFGVDFLLDEKLRPWMLEINRNPNFLIVTKGRNVKFTNLILDFSEIPIQYVRSKYKRVREFINQKVIPLMRENEGKLSKTIKNQLWNEYQEVIKDRLEPEFQLSEKNKSKMVYFDGKPTFDHPQGCF